MYLNKALLVHALLAVGKSDTQRILIIDEDSSIAPNIREIINIKMREEPKFTISDKYYHRSKGDRKGGKRDRWSQ